MDFQALHDADAALGIEDPAEALTALRQQTVTLTDQPFKWKDAKRVARESATGDWSRIVLRARATTASAAVFAAINAVESADDDVIDPKDPASWETFQAGLAALEGSGDLSAGTIAALNALSTVVRLQWPDLDFGHLQTARNV